MKTGLTPEQALFTILGAVNSISPWNKNGIGIVWLGPIPIVIVTRPETAEIILGSNTLTHKSVHYEFISDWLGQGLLTSNGNKWKTRRKMLTPSFHFKILEDFIPVMVGQTKILIEILDKKVDIDDGIVDDVSKLILHCALDVICGEFVFSKF
jgi:cytochrome P450 family 4 subfamily V